MQIELFSAKCSGDPALMAEVRRTMQLAEELDRSIDFLTWELRPAALDRLGLPAALDDLVHAWSERFHTPAEYHDGGMEGRSLPPDVGVNLYRIAQEALHNVQKHAAATEVSVRLAMHEASAVLAIEDNGQGFTPGAVGSTSRDGLGLVSMRERARLIGGEITIEAAPGRGTSIVVRVPVDDRVPDGRER
jgi:signal transduction histidine kinase